MALHTVNLYPCTDDRYCYMYMYYHTVSPVLTAGTVTSTTIQSSVQKHIVKKAA